MSVQININETTTTVKMDMPKQHKLNAVSTERFIEISEQIKKSIGLSCKLSTPFGFSHPEAPIINSNSVGANGISDFLFAEPLQKLSDADDAAVAQLVEQVSSLNLHDDEFTIKFKCSTSISDEIVSNAINDDMQSIGDDLGSSKEEDVDNVTSNYGNTNLQISSLEIDCSEELDVKNELHSNDDIQENLVQENGITEHENDNSEPSSVVDSNRIVDENIKTFSLQMNYGKDKDVSNSEALVVSIQNIPASGVQLNCCDEPDDDSSVLQKDVNENIEMNCSKTQDEDVDKNETPNDDNNNSEGVVNRSGDLNPDTQITHLDVDNNKRNPLPQYQIDKQPQPFEIEDVRKITWPNQAEVAFPQVMQLFGQTFKTVMVYGVVTSLNIDEGGLAQRFVIDDGSGSIEVVWNASRKLKGLIRTLGPLLEEVRQCRQSGLAMMNESWQLNTKECTEMLDSFDGIIHIIKRQISKQTKLKLFGHAAVVGKPFRPSGKEMKLYSELIEGNSSGSSLELYFKTNLVRLYEEKYMSGR